jgi:hypothetical protein
MLVPCQSAAVVMLGTVPVSRIVVTSAINDCYNAVKPCSVSFKCSSWVFQLSLHACLALICQALTCYVIVTAAGRTQGVC